MRLVDEQPRAVLARELDDLRERREIAVHREDRVGRDQPPPLAAVAAQAPREVLGVEVPVDADARSREPAAVDDRGVVERVGEHGVAGAGERPDRAEVREVAGAEQDAVFAAFESRQALLQAPVDRHRPGHKPRCAGADAPAHRGLRRCLAHARIVGEAEVVVRAQQQHRLAVEQHARSLRPEDRAQAAAQAEPLDLPQALLDLSSKNHSTAPVVVR